MTEPNYKKRLKSGTGSAIELDQTGHTVPASGYYSIEPGRYFIYANIMDETGGTTLHQKILDGDVIVNDGQRDLSADRGIDYLKHPDRAWNIRFESDPDRTNGFTSKNVQEAIEEARSSSSGISVQKDDTTINSATTTLNFEGSAVTSVIDEGLGKTTVTVDTGAIGGRTFNVPFYNNGNTANKWLFHIPTSDATDELPYVTAWNVEIFGILFSNKNANINCDVEFYVNGTNNAAKIHTVEVRDYKNYWETTVTSFFTMNAGDRLSIYIKRVGNQTPSSVEVDLNMRITSTAGSTGGNNG